MLKDNENGTELIHFAFKMMTKKKSWRGGRKRAKSSKFPAIISLKCIHLKQHIYPKLDSNKIRFHFTFLANEFLFFRNQQNFAKFILIPKMASGLAPSVLNLDMHTYWRW